MYEQHRARLDYSNTFYSPLFDANLPLLTERKLCYPYSIVADYSKADTTVTELNIDEVLASVKQTSTVHELRPTTTTHSDCCSC